MTFEEILDQAIAMLQRRGRVSYRALQRQFQLDDAYLQDLTTEIIEVLQLAVDQDNTMLVWTGGSSVPAPVSPPPSRTSLPDSQEPHLPPRGSAPDVQHTPESLFEKYQAASRLSIKRVIATYTNVSLVLGNSS